MDVPCSAAAVPRAGGNSPLATSGPSATQSNLLCPKVPAAVFPKSRRLLKRKEFRRVYDEGARLSSASYAVFHLNRGGDGQARAGFSVPKALGKAVVRNRLRRRLREAVRLELWRIDGPWDFVFHPRKPVLEISMPALRREVERILAKCGTS